VIRTPATAREIERTWEIEVFSAFIILVVTLLSGFAGGQAAAQAQESIGAVSRIQGEERNAWRRHTGARPQRVRLSQRGRVDR